MRDDYASDAFSVLVEGELVHISSRIAFCPGFWSCSSGSLATATSRCLFTRSNNGFERQAALNAISPLNEPWSVPYVVALAADYVKEIVCDLHGRIDELDGDQVGRFLRANPRFAGKTFSRIASYWDAYRRSDATWRNDAGCRIVAKFAEWTRIQNS